MAYVVCSVLSVFAMCMLLCMLQFSVFGGCMVAHPCSHTFRFPRTSIAQIILITRTVPNYPPCIADRRAQRSVPRTRPRRNFSSNGILQSGMSHSVSFEAGVMDPGECISKLVCNAWSVIYFWREGSPGGRQRQLAHNHGLLRRRRPHFDEEGQRTYVVSTYTQLNVLRSGTVVPQPLRHQDSQTFQGLLTLTRAPYEAEDAQIIFKDRTRT